ncbi:hypothetical protein [Novosphingobium sp. EMRT-2]|uniref:hypothetical protein n=1 Tax=Novosphingobium sp. EMRT-2 TaxID=2571749 RepID=UPI00143D77F9|nr:hypothetical protein [Novosphingobium sp. EMRT-2]
MKRKIKHADGRAAEMAFEVHAALLRTETATPSLRDNPLWIMLRQDAYETFYLALDKII